jgi:CMP-2-keto-3-deoxyoctulosonic acid synthetase
LTHASAQQLEKAKVKELATMSTEEVIEKLRVMKYQRAPESRELVKEMEPDGIDEADDDDGTEDS